jgi:glycosyltransferase involved in cell wall biosynthesis
MKILWLSPHRGAPWIDSLAKKLLEIGDVNLTILEYSHNQKEPIIEKKENGIHYIILKVPSKKVDLLSFFKIRIKIIKSYLNKIYREYDLIHIHGSEHEFHVSSYHLDIPQVLSIQGILDECKKVLNTRYFLADWRITRWYLGAYYERKYLPKIKNFICRTHWDKAFVKRIHPNANIFHNWEPLREPFHNYIYNAQSSNIAFVGGDNTIKGLREILIAFNLIKDELPCKLIVMGSCKPSKIKEIIEQENLQNISEGDVERVGFCKAEQMLEIYSNCFCLVHPTYIDNSPNSVCEAQLAGLPVIASNVGGVSSLINHMETGLLTSLNPVEIAKNISLLYNNPELRKSISEKARSVAQKRHDSNEIAQITLNIYQNIIENHT